MSTAVDGHAGLDRETLDMILESIREFMDRRLPAERLLELDATHEFPEAEVRAMCGELGIQLLFIPEAYDGMGGGAFDVYRVCEVMAHLDLGIATGVLATFLGSDPILWGGTEGQKDRWMTRIANEGLLMAYAATEPEAGSDLAALRTTATPVEEAGTVAGYRINGAKIWISNGGYADLFSVLALAPGGRAGSSWSAGRTVSTTASRKTSTGSGRATRRRSPSTTCRSRRRTSSGGWRGRD